MRGAIIYFSGTGNTEFAAKMFKRGFEDKGIHCTTIDIAKKKGFNDEYDFLVFGSPTHSESFPELFLDWVKSNVKEGRGRDVIVFSTRGAEGGRGPEILGEVLRSKGFINRVQDNIDMPNNFCIAGNKAPHREKIISLKNSATIKISKIIETFLAGRSYIKIFSRTQDNINISSGRSNYPSSGNWAKENLTVDMSLCVKCRKCVKNCPVKNIGLLEEFVFKDKCIYCQKCIHSCPVNAYLYRGQKIEQYKI